MERKKAKMKPREGDNEGDENTQRRMEEKEERKHSDTGRRRTIGGRLLLRERPLIIHRALSTPIEGENRSCEPESSHHAQPLASLSFPSFPF